MFLYFSFCYGDIINVPQDQPTIQAGIDSAYAGDTVLVAENTYYENIDFKGKAITVASQFIMDGDTSHISRTIIDGSQPDTTDSASVVYFISGEDSTSVICGFTITGGNGTYWTAWNWLMGGGIYMINSGAKISNNIISKNTINSEIIIAGAGIANLISWDSPLRSPNIIITENIIRYNSIEGDHACWGAGIYINNQAWEEGYCRISNNLISHNSVTSNHPRGIVGGGIAIDSNLPTVGIIIISSNVIMYMEVAVLKYIIGNQEVFFTIIIPARIYIITLLLIIIQKFMVQVSQY
jgi:hypothetical protein